MAGHHRLHDQLVPGASATSNAFVELVSRVKVRLSNGNDRLPTANPVRTRRAHLSGSAGPGAVGGPVHPHNGWFFAAVPQAAADRGEQREHAGARLLTTLLRRPETLRP